MPSIQTPEYKERRKKLFYASVSIMTKCKKCNNELDGTHYWMKLKRKYARDSICKDCQKTALSAYKKGPGYKDRRRKHFEDTVGELKKCRNCGEDKDGTHYYFHASTKLARDPECKECTSSKLKEYSQTPEAKEKRRKYEKERYARRWKEGDPVVHKRSAVNGITRHALNAGIIHQPSGCERCGQVCKPQAHHRTPCKDLTVDTIFDIEWLCRECHLEEHKP